MDLSLADEGAIRIDWARSRRPVLAALRKLTEIDKPLAGMRADDCFHVTRKRSSNRNNSSNRC